MWCQGLCQDSKVEATGSPTHVHIHNYIQCSTLPNLQYLHTKRMWMYTHCYSIFHFYYLSKSSEPLIWSMAELSKPFIRGGQLWERTKTVTSQIKHHHVCVVLKSSSKHQTNAPNGFFQMTTDYENKRQIFPSGKTVTVKLEKLEVELFSVHTQK